MRVTHIRHYAVLAPLPSKKPACLAVCSNESDAEALKARHSSWPGIEVRPVEGGVVVIDGEKLVICIDLAGDWGVLYENERQPKPSAPAVESLS